MNRRQAIRLIGATGAAMLPSIGTTRAATKRPLVVYLTTGHEAQKMPLISAFLDGMRGLGYTEGQGFDIAYRFSGEDYTQLGALAEDLLRLGPDVIVAPETGPSVAARKATLSIPIVGCVLVDPIGAGLIASHARPGGNVTGIMVAVEGLSKKQVEIARDLLPGAGTVGVMINPANPSHRPQRAEIETATGALGMTIVAAEVRDESDLDKAFHTLIEARVQAVIITRDSLLLAERKHTAELAVAARLPTFYGLREEVEAGGLVSYGVSLPANYRRAAYFVGKILNGTNPADLPVEFPTKLEMVINLRSAKMLGITVPPTLLTQADEVIE